ncbi:MAG TPA: hypothetical protein VN222_10295 [Novosphingobium sp.]|nr:hypothetical protein [Novosphingobium sp.]
MTDRTMLDWQRHDMVAARSDARDALARTPAESRTLAAYAMTRLLDHDPAGANQAFRLAAQLGWRDRLTQLYWLNQALELGDMRVAALRLDALLRQEPERAADEPAVTYLESLPDGRAQWVARMAERPNWLLPYALQADKLPLAEVVLRAQTLRELAGHGTVLGCIAVSPLVERLIAGGAVDAARDLWLAQCPGAAGHVVTDGRFIDARPDQTLASFAWQFMGQPDASAQLAPGSRDGQRQVMMTTTGTGPVILLRQLVMAPRGPMRLRWRAVDEEGHASDRILAAVSCSQSPVQPLLPGKASQPGGYRELAVDVDAGCPAHWLYFAIAPGASGVGLEDVSMVR